MEPKPDLLLNHQGSEGEYVLVECKRTMFGPDSTAAQQARGLLLQTGEQINTVLGRPLEASALVHLTYVARHCDDPNPAEGLAETREQLMNNGFPVADAGVICLLARDDGIYIRAEYEPGVVPTDLQTLIHPELLVEPLIDGEDPLPLLIVPWDPDSDQDGPVAQVGKEVLRQRILASFVERIGKLVPGISIEVEYDELLNEATFYFYQRWQVRNASAARALRGFCRELVSNTLKGLPGTTLDSLGAGRAGRRITLESQQAKDAAIDAVTKASRGSGSDIPKPEEMTVPLDNDEW